jgi:hypothetical protein
MANRGPSSRQFTGLRPGSLTGWVKVLRRRAGEFLIAHGARGISLAEMTRRLELLVPLVAAACGIASLTHFYHNAEFCGDYPNLPAWITRGSVWLAWTGITFLGGTGLWLFRSGYRKSGLGVLAVYGALGCDGLGHYSLAPMARHTATMNFAIWFEVIAGATLFAVALGALIIEGRRPTRSARVG